MNTKYAEEFSKILKKMRNDRKLTFMDISTSIGISAGYLCDIENKLPQRERVIIPQGEFILKLLDFYNQEKKFTEEEKEKIILVIGKFILNEYFPKEIFNKLELKIKK